MKKTFLICSFLVIGFLYYSCSSERRNKAFQEIQNLRKVDSISLELDAKTSFEFQNVHYYANDTIEWLVALNLNINGLNIYDLKTSNLISQFSIPITGPNSVPSLNGMTFVSPDSIFLYSKMSLLKYSPKIGQ